MLRLIRLGMCVLLPSMVLAGMIEYRVDVNVSDTKVNVWNNYDKISITGYDNLTTPGQPSLPAKILSFVIPSDGRFENIEILNEQGEYLAGTFKILPAQKPVPISFSKGAEFTQPDANIYSLNTLYPNTSVQFAHEGYLTGYHIVSVLVTPLKYNPVTKKLHLTNHLIFRLNYQSGANPMKMITEAQKNSVQERVMSRVVNKSQVEPFSPMLKRGFGQAEYIIITDSSFVNAFKPLKDWKTRRGVPTEIVTTSWIYATYTGNDNPDRVRNFIKAAYDSGAIYFLLGGQCDFEHGEQYVPRRDCYCMTSYVGAYNDEDTIPCDLYFADLDDDWDASGNGVYGEYYDYVDMYSDVYVGRAPVKNTTQIGYFISKVMTYESSPALLAIEKILLPVGNLWSTNHGNGCNNAIADTTPDDWQKSKLYQDYGFMNTTIVRDSINTGYNLSHMTGHGNEFGIYYNYGSTSYYDCGDPSSQTNDSTDAIITNSIACFTGAVDKNGSGNDCLAEKMINTNKRCATATIMNSRYGWGYSSPEGAIGPSDELSVWFYRKLFGTGAYHLGEVLAAAKDMKVPAANSDMYFRWCLFEYNLFGDPEMPIWTDSVKNLAVGFSDTIALFGDGKADTLDVTVQYLGSPVNGALVTIMQDSTAYARQTTNASGVARFILADNTFQHEGNAWVTVTYYSQNFLPYLGYGYVAQDMNIAELPNQGYATFHVVVSPNLVKHAISLNLGAPVNNKVLVKIYDIRGSLTQSVEMNKGATEIAIPTTGFSSGVYFLKTEGDVRTEHKIIVVK